MDTPEIVEMLKGASLHNLHKIRLVVEYFLDDSKRIWEFKRRLYVGRDILFLNEDENRYIPARILKIKRSRLDVENLEDHRRWDIPFYLAYIDDSEPFSYVDTENCPKQNKNQYQIGMKVVFRDKRGIDRYGEIEKLNKKTASIVVDGEEKWRVDYGLLSQVIET